VQTFGLPVILRVLPLMAYELVVPQRKVLEDFLRKNKFTDFHKTKNYISESGSVSTIFPDDGDRSSLRNFF
jgi:hypothetical protein